MTSRHRIPRLAVTGGIGSGKSTAVAYLRELGAASVSADDLVHDLLGEASIVGRIERRHGDAVVSDDAVDRAALAQVVFDDAAELAWLEKLLHPQVRRLIGEWASGQEGLSQRPALLVAEVPLLFESGMEGEFDHVLLITAPEAVRRKRLAAKLTESQFRRRAARQIDEADKAVRSDFVFENGTVRLRLKDFMAEVYAQILADAAPRRRSGLSRG